MIRKLLLLLLLATPLVADETSFFIERIEVRNHHRVSPDVVIAESRLRTGRAYTEDELRDAATRLSRLPFLLSVDFSLEKGAERGNYILILTINETRPFFFHLDAVPILDDGSTSHFGITYEDRPSTNREGLAAGFRWFVGRRGAVHIGFTATRQDREFVNDYASFVAGYTQYDLFGTRAFATLNIKRPVEGYGEGLLSPQVVLGVPLSPNQTVTIEYDEARFKGKRRNAEGVPVDMRHGQKVLSARWSYNTTNEPFFPTEGTLLTVRPHVAWDDGQRSFGASPAVPEHKRAYGIESGATRYRELTERDSVWGDLSGRWEHIDRRADIIELFPPNDRSSSATIGIGYARSLWTREERAGGDSRFEFTGRYTRHFQQEYRVIGYDDQDVLQAGWSWIRRSSWGTLRLGVGYAW